MAKRDWVEDPSIQKIFREHPIMAHVVMAESSGNPNAINKQSGASGLAQLMPGTATGGKDSKGRKTYAHGMYGKTLTNAELFDPVKNLKFASEYLAALKKTFGTTEDALKAYNWGPGNYKNFLKKGYWIERKNGKTIKHTELPPETRNYVKKIKSRVGQTPPFVKAASAAERKRRGRPTEGVDPSDEARQLRLIKAKILKDRGEDKMATPAQIGRLEKEIQLDKKLGMSKANIATKQARLKKMRAQVKKVSAKQKADARAKKAASYGGQGGLSPSDARSIAIAAKKDNAVAKRKKAKATAKRTAALASMMDAPGSGKTRAARKVTKPQKLTAAEQRLADIQREAATRKKERDRLKTIKKPTKKQIRDLELIKPGAAAAAAGKTPKFINKQDAERTGVGRVSLPKPKDPLAVDIQGKGSKPTSTVREQQKAEKTKADVVAARKRYLAKQKAKATAKRTAALASMMDAPGSGKTRKGRKPKPLELQDSKVPVSREVKEREFLGFGGGIDPAAGVPFKIPPKGKRKPIAQLMDAPGGGPKIKKRKPIAQLMDAPGGGPKIKKRKPIAQLMDAPGSGKTRAARKVRKASVDTTADFADEYEKDQDFIDDKYVTSGSGDFVLDSSGSPITRGDFRISTDSDDYDVGHKHGGKVGKGKKKAKSRKRTTKGRKRAALRGHRAELRGG